ncbi:MAG: C1 family peptidase [Sphingomonas sp.]
MSDTWNGRNLTGCIFEADPGPAPKLNATMQATNNLPRHVDLRAHCTPIEDQETTSSCVANAIVGALELHQRKAGLPLTDLSRLFLYYNARSLEKKEGEDCGSTIHRGMAAVLAFGVCEERLWPFEKAMVTANPTEACYQNATHYNAIQFARTPRGEPAWAALAQGLPVAFGMFVPIECYHNLDENGVMPMPEALPQVSPPCGHAMLIVGYDLDQKHYIVRNSWGTKFGHDGYYKLPFEIAERATPENQYWTIGAIEQSPGLGIFGPTVTDSVKHVTDQAGGPSALDQLRKGLRQELNSRLDTARAGFRDRLRGGH